MIKEQMSQLIKEDKKSEFPIEIFPDPIKNYFIEANSTLDSNIDYMACSMLWGLASVIGNSCNLEVKTGWKEYANIWIAIIGNQGVGKTHSISMATRPFERINSDLITQYPRKHKEWQDVNGDEENEPKPEQFIVNDITIEALVSLHSKNQNCVAMFREELDGWVKNMSRYSNGSDLPFWLSTWSGKAVSMNRKSGDSYLAKPFIPILGGVQPEILDSFSTNENKVNGFMDRILLCCPEIEIGMYNSNEMSVTAIQYYDDFVKKFYNSIKMDIKKSQDGEIIPNTFKLSPEAKYEWEKAYNEISIMQNSDDENEYMKSVLPKQKSYIPRFCLIIHLMNNFSEAVIPDTVSIDSVLKAVKLSKYFIKQAQKVKVSAKETKSIHSIVASNKEATPKDTFKLIFEKGGKINYTKVAEILGVDRSTLYNWSKELKKVSDSILH